MVSSRMMTLHQIVCADPSIAASLKPLAHHRNVASLSFFYCYYLVDVYLNWLNCFHFLILVLVPLVIVMGCIIFLSPFLVKENPDRKKKIKKIDVIRMTMSTVSFLAQLDPGILCPQNAFLSSMI